MPGQDQGDVRFRAIIAKKVLRAKSYRGAPATRAQQLELTQAEVAEMLPKIKGRPICYTHDPSVVVGEVEDAEVDPVTGAWKVGYVVRASTQFGRAAVGWIKQGRCHGISLQHWLVDPHMLVSDDWLRLTLVCLMSVSLVPTPTRRSRCRSAGRARARGA